MADEQQIPKDLGDDFQSDDPSIDDEGDYATLPDEEQAEVPSGPIEVVPEAPVAPVAPEAPATTPVADEYDDDEPIEDYVVKLVVNEEPEQSTSVKDLIDAAVTDTNGHLIPAKTSAILDAVDQYTSSVVNEIAGATTAISDGGKHWWSGSWGNYIILGLIALCIIGILLVLLFLFLRRKKSGGNNKRPAGGSTTTAQNVVNKQISPDHKYERVANP